MNRNTVSLATILLLSLCMLVTTGNIVLAQNASLIYTEREAAITQTPLVFKHRKGGPLFMALSRAGLFTLDSVTLKPAPVEVVAAGKYTKTTTSQPAAMETSCINNQASLAERSTELTARAKCSLWRCLPVISMKLHFEITVRLCLR